MAKVTVEVNEKYLNVAKTYSNVKGIPLKKVFEVVLDDCMEEKFAEIADRLEELNAKL